VSDHIAEKRIGGVGSVVSDLEWDVKTYLVLNGATHDAAVGCWGTKRVYDSVRPISMVRYMGGLGQSTDGAGPSYAPNGLPLVPGVIEVITAQSSAPGERHEALAPYVGEIAVLSWPGEPADVTTQYSGVRWVRAKEWVPYQRKTFVTPAFPDHLGAQHVQRRRPADAAPGRPLPGAGFASPPRRRTRSSSSRSARAKRSSPRRRTTTRADRPTVAHLGPATSARTTSAAASWARPSALRAWDKAVAYFDGTARP
jgi:hypothetical protein